MLVPSRCGNRSARAGGTSSGNRPRAAGAEASGRMRSCGGSAATSTIGRPPKAAAKGESRAICSRRHGERQRQHASGKFRQEAGKGERVTLVLFGNHDETGSRRVRTRPARPVGGRSKGAELEIGETFRPIPIGERKPCRVEARGCGGIRRPRLAVLVDRQVFVQFQLQMPPLVQAPFLGANRLIRERLYPLPAAPAARTRCRPTPSCHSAAAFQRSLTGRSLCLLSRRFRPGRRNPGPIA